MTTHSGCNILLQLLGILLQTVSQLKVCEGTLIRSTKRRPHHKTRSIKNAIATSSQGRSQTVVLHDQRHLFQSHVCMGIWAALSYPAAPSQNLLKSPDNREEKWMLQKPKRGPCLDRHRKTRRCQQRTHDDIPRGWNSRRPIGQIQPRGGSGRSKVGSLRGRTTLHIVTTACRAVLL